MDFTGFYWFLINGIGFVLCFVLLGFTWFYSVSLGFTGFSLILLSGTGFHWALLFLFFQFERV